MNEQKKKQIGKFISFILRHEPSKIGLSLTPEGWANTAELISKCNKYRIHFTMKELEEIVETNNKKRYSFNSDKIQIRANQGHSIPVDLELDAIQPPEFLYHGTATRFLQNIKKDGIKKMSRQYVHLSNDKETAIIVGQRHGIPVVLTILAGKMYQDGVLFYRTANGVWLTESIQPEYISN